MGSNHIFDPGEKKTIIIYSFTNNLYYLHFKLK